MWMFADPNWYNLGVKGWGYQVKIVPSLSQMSVCGDHCGQWFPISTLSNHSLYSWWVIRTVKMLWCGSSDPNWHNLGVQGWGYQMNIVQSLGVKCQLVVTIVDNVSQSDPCQIIHYTHDEWLEQSRCCDVDLQTQTDTIFVFKVGAFKWKLSPPWVKCQLV